MKKIIKIFLKTLLWLIAGVLHLWSALALAYVNLPQNSPYVKFIVPAYLIAVYSFVLLNKRKTRTLLLSLIVYVGVLLWFHSIRPDPNAVYPAHLQMPHAEINGEQVVIHKVRNSDYRTQDDFDVHYETREYDLQELQTLDVYVNYWGMDMIAHTFVSFGFADGRYIAVSIETRPEVGEVYGILDGIFKRYELIYVWGDERDLVRSRTNYRKEDAYLYRASFSREMIKKLFLSMLKATNRLEKQSQFYNTLIHSCTNTIGDHIKHERIMKVPFYKRRFLTGSIDRRMYKEGMIETFGLPFDRLRQIAKINERAQAAEADPAFSAKIRTHF
jgi:hypothetical protein